MGLRRSATLRRPAGNLRKKIPRWVRLAPRAFRARVPQRTKSYEKHGVDGHDCNNVFRSTVFEAVGERCNKPTPVQSLEQSKNCKSPPTDSRVALEKGPGEQQEGAE